MSPATTSDSSVVLVVAPSESTVKRIESHLRNLGHAIRTAWVVDIEDVEEALRRGAPDLVLCSMEPTCAPCEDVLRQCRQLAPDLPVIVLMRKVGIDERIAAMGLGARDCVAGDDERDLRHLELVVLRELAAHRNARDLRVSRKRLQDFASRHEELLSATNDAVAHIQEGILSQLNPAFAQLLGHDDPTALLGLPLMDLVGPEFQPKVKEHLRLLLRGKTDDRGLDCALLHRDGHPVPIQARLTVSEVEGEQLLEMLIPQSRAAAAVAAESAVDRLGFYQALDTAVAEPAGKLQRAATLITIDQFAQLEQQLGPSDAEQALLQLRDWIAARLGGNDQLFRFSPQELAVLLGPLDVASLPQWGETLIRDISQHIFSTARHEAQLTVSIAAYPFSHGETTTAIVAELTKAARQFAARGRQFALLGDTAKNALSEREEARRIEMVRKALVDNRLKLAYQSIASLEGDPRQHFDVLVRLIDEQGVELHASEFLGAAEKSGQMRLIDRWVTTQALKTQTKRSNAEGVSSLFVKISEETLKDSEAFVGWLREQLANRPLHPGEMVFEFQELTLQNHIRKAKLITRELIALGAQVCVEHFGIGSNSAQMIEHIPMQYVKFHASFAKNLADKETQRKMNALIELAKQRKIKVIVSHIEDANAMARLWQMGVNFIQGYHVQEPEVVMLAADMP